MSHLQSIKINIHIYINTMKWVHVVCYAVRNTYLVLGTYHVQSYLGMHFFALDIEHNL